MKLDIYLRTCTRTGVHNSKRIIDDDRSTMVKKCLGSLFNAIKAVDMDSVYVFLHIVDDNSSAEFLDWLQANIPCDYEIESSDEPLGYIKTAERQFQWAVETGSDFIYLLEDDYFHSEKSLNIMINGLQSLDGLTGDIHSSAIFPYDCIDRYNRDYPEPCRIFYGNGLYWRTVTKSSNTVFMKHETFRIAYPFFAHLASNYNPDGSCTEDHTINKLYGNMVTHGGPIVLFSPIPSLAVHIEYKEPTYITDEGISNFHKDWLSFLST